MKFLRNIIPPEYQIKLRHVISIHVISIIFIFLLVCFGCSKHRDDNRLFLENTMIRQHGLYVLVGSKPMISFNIDCNAHGRVAKRFHMDKLWEFWKNDQSLQMDSKYLFTQRTTPFVSDRNMGLFINMPNLFTLLNRYYDDFAKVYGQSFDPQIVVHEIGDDASLFWKKVFESQYLQGLLFGYGQENALRFEKHRGIECYPGEIKPDIREIAHIAFKSDIQVPDLMIPSICYYIRGDETVDKYQRERETIINEFQGKDFEQTVISWLSGAAN